MTAKTTEPTQLTEDAMREIEGRHWHLSDTLAKCVTLTLPERDALIRDWRAVRAENEQLHADAQELSERLIKSADRCGELITDNAALREQLAHVLVCSGSPRDCEACADAAASVKENA